MDKIKEATILKIQTFGEEHAVKIPRSDNDCTDVLRATLLLLELNGFHKNSIKNSVIELAEEFEECKEKD